MLTLILEHAARPERRGIFRRRRAPELRWDAAVRFGVRALELSVPACGDPARDAEALDTAAELLRGRGVREAVSATPRLEREMAARGVPPPQRRPLEQAMLLRTALEVARLRGAESAAVVARRRSRELDAAVKSLAAQVRNVAVLLPPGAEDYARELRWSLGLSVRTDAAALASAEVKLLLAEPWSPLGRGAAVGYVPHAEIGLEVVQRLGYSFPPAVSGSVYPPERVASALIRAGAMRPEEVGIKDLRLANAIDNLPFSHYNAIWNAEIREAENFSAAAEVRRPSNRKAGSI